MPLIEPAYTYRGVIRSIYDGDTIRVDLDLGFSTWIRDQSLRLYGIDTPEVRGPERPQGLVSKAWLEARIPPETHVIVETLKDKTGKYGRYLAIIWHEGVNLNEALVAEGLAERYLL
ncbi:thermonuclease family protein [Roseitranquillus sediminis]|uniref:thermonuclease family protein n=1 Tax=Roseitranquillus sediminis TaxID=2809051 RepID=UPI001D0C55E6|nr:thermonuclease family protein [Roseitranquillus sediminis]MBM9593824.1 thermonuclease family protein [Roseitranquillus sediminis]